VSADVTLRILPGLSLGRATRVLERNVLVYRRSAMILLSGFVEPLFYLFALGLGVGGLVGEVRGPDGTGTSYAQFIAPALLAASAMNGAIYESTFNVFFKLKYGRVYDAMLATPVSPRDIALGEIGWSMARGGLYAVGFLTVTWVLGLVQSAWALLALPAALLVGFAFAAAGMAATTYMKSWQDFDMIGLITLPLFLFSATFYPLEIYPPALQLLTHVSPLYHGVALIRGLMFGYLDPAMLGHVLVLAAIGLGGLWLTARRIRGLLLR
jgi:lipooligosaccharide transport system permease protein